MTEAAAISVTAKPVDDTQTVAEIETTPFISIVLPCLNEEDGVGVCVRKARGWLNRSGYSGEVVVVDNGSTDRSVEEAGSAGARVVHEAARGYGAALRRGFAEASGDWLIMADCDDTYELSDLTPMVHPLADGADLVIGNRFAGGIASGAMTWSHRYIGTPAISLLIKVFSGLKVGDSQCGLRAFTRRALDRMDLHADGMELASEMVLKAARRGLRVADVPVPYAERIGDAKLDTLRDGWRHLRFLLLASPNYLFTIPGAVLTVLGVLTLALALPAEGLAVGNIHWDPKFAGGIFVVIGMNALLLGIAARVFTTAKGITIEDAVLRFYRRYLGLETLIGLGLLLIVVGSAIDVLLVFGHPAALSKVDIAAIAQTMIIVGGNLALVGALVGLLESS
jgi:glycosyltransferase involved in cell wall biosynthesis